MTNRSIGSPSLILCIAPAVGTPLGAVLSVYRLTGHRPVATEAANCS